MVLLSSWVEGFAQEKQKDATIKPFVIRNEKFEATYKVFWLPFAKQVLITL